MTLRALVGVALAGVVAAGVAVGAAPAGPTVELTVSRRGFEPSRIVLRRGETAQLVVSSDDGDHCLAIDALRIEKRVARGRPTRIELTPDRSGTFPFHCCLETGKQAEQEKGDLIVSE